MMDFNINAQDLIDVLVSQRNAALDEVARQGVIIKTLIKKLEDGSKQEVIPFPAARSIDQGG
jgi:cell division protein FtsB